jgi:hypothetical protein
MKRLRFSQMVKPCYQPKFVVSIAYRGGVRVEGSRYKLWESEEDSNPCGNAAYRAWASTLTVWTRTNEAAVC